MSWVIFETHNANAIQSIGLWSNSRIHFLQCYQHIAVFPNEGPCCLSCLQKIQCRSFATQASRKLPEYGAVGHWTTDFLPTAELGPMKMVLLLISWRVWSFCIQCYKSEEITVGLNYKNACAESTQTPSLSRALSLSFPPFSPIHLSSSLSLSISYVYEPINICEFEALYWYTFAQHRASISIKVIRIWKSTCETRHRPHLHVPFVLSCDIHITACDMAMTMAYVCIKLIENKNWIPHWLLCIVPRWC